MWRCPYVADKAVTYHIREAFCDACVLYSLLLATATSCFCNPSKVTLSDLFDFRCANDYQSGIPGPARITQSTEHGYDYYQTRWCVYALFLQTTLSGLCIDYGSMTKILTN